jgi:Transglycosylase-like domain
MKKLAIGLVLLACVPAAHAAQKTPQPDSWILQDIVSFRDQTWRYQRTMGVRSTPYAHSAVGKHGRGYKLWVRELWHSRAKTARKRFVAGPPHRAGWQCIHRYEGPWNARTGNGFYGGLQMDYGFMRTYGAHLLRKKGTADRWTPLEQMWVAEKAHRSGRGFGPWTNTARACGLV